MFFCVCECAENNLLQTFHFLLVTVLCEAIGSLLFAEKYLSKRLGALKMSYSGLKLPIPGS